MTRWNEQISQTWINRNVFLYLFLNLTHASPSSRLSGQGSHNPSINICVNELKPSIIHWNVTIYTAHGQENALSNVSRLFSFWRVFPSVLYSSLDGAGISTFTATTKIGARWVLVWACTLPPSSFYHNAAISPYLTILTWGCATGIKGSHCFRLIFQPPQHTHIHRHTHILCSLSSSWDNRSNTPWWW